MKKNIFCTVLMFLLRATVVHSQDNWNNQNPATKPLLINNAMAFIGGDHVMQFGGLDESFNSTNDTWVYDLSDNNWILKNPVTKPSARYEHAMAYIGDDKVLLYGGNGAGVETWIYDLSDNTWTLKNPATNPSARNLHAMAWLGDDKVLLFGGAGSVGTWVYDLSENTWTPKSPAIEPSGRYTHAMSSIGGDQVVLFGGQSFNDETWVYDLSDNNWTLKNPASKPIARAYHGMASLGGDKVLLFGGVGQSIPLLGDTWVYDLSDDAWTQKSPSSTPGDRYTHLMSSIGGNKVLLSGGYPGTDETWLYTGAGSACNMTVSAGADEHLYYGYAPGQCKIKTAVVTGGTAPFTYSWTLNRALLPAEIITGSNTASVTLCLMDTAELCVTVTDAANCAAAGCAMMFAEDVRCGTGNNQKVTICHNNNTICVDASAVNGHLNHGDYVGPCGSAAANPDGMDVMMVPAPGFNIYPNPNYGNVIVTLNADESNIAEKILQVININGQIIQQLKTSGQNQLKINLRNPGVYFIKLISDRQVVTKKLVVLN
jgi:hypothetical protein